MTCEAQGVGRRGAGRHQCRHVPLSPHPHVPTCRPPAACLVVIALFEGPQTLKPPSVQVEQEGDVRTASCEGGLGAARIGECPIDGDEGTRVEAPARRPAVLGQRAPCPSQSAGRRAGRAGGSGPAPAAAVAWAHSRGEVSRLLRPLPPTRHAESTCTSRPALPGLLLHSPESGIADTRH